MTSTDVTVTEKTFKVKIADVVGYSRETLTWEELPDGARATVAGNPDSGVWRWQNEEAGAWEIWTV